MKDSPRAVVSKSVQGTRPNTSPAAVMQVFSKLQMNCGPPFNPSIVNSSFAQMHPPHKVETDVMEKGDSDSCYQPAQRMLRLQRRPLGVFESRVGLPW